MTCVEWGWKVPQPTPTSASHTTTRMLKLHQTSTGTFAPGRTVYAGPFSLCHCDVLRPFQPLVYTRCALGTRGKGQKVGKYSRLHCVSLERIGVVVVVGCRFIRMVCAGQRAQIRVFVWLTVIIIIRSSIRARAYCTNRNVNGLVGPSP